jgi:hypothetical protein
VKYDTTPRRKSRTEQGQDDPLGKVLLYVQAFITITSRKRKVKSPPRNIIFAKKCSDSKIYFRIHLPKIYLCVKSTIGPFACMPVGFEEGLVSFG